MLSSVGDRVDRALEFRRFTPGGMIKKERTGNRERGEDVFSPGRHLRDPIWLPKPLPTPETAPVAPLEKGKEPAPRPVVGSKQEFWVWDMSVMPPGHKKVTATCRAVGDKAYIFVDDAVWNRLVTEDDVYTINKSFQRNGPPGSAWPGKGTAEVDHAYFGTPPLGLDGDPKVYVLLTEIASFKGTTMDGYFNPFDTIPDEQAQQMGQHSNEKEIIYLNAASRRISSDYMLSVLSHEYQHLLHYPHDQQEESWLSETMAEAAMAANGFHTDYGHVLRHLSHPERPLVSQTYVDYGACMLFSVYLLERYGKGFYQELTRNPAHGIESIESTLRSLGQDTTFEELYRDWLVANYADSQNVVTPGLHYSTLDLPVPDHTEVQAGSSSFEVNLPFTGGRYFKLPPDEMNLRWDGNSDGLTLDLLSFAGKKLIRTPLRLGPDGKTQVPSGNDRVLVVGSMAPTGLKGKLSFEPVSS